MDSNLYYTTIQLHKSLLFATILYLISDMNTGSRVYSFEKDDKVFYGLYIFLQVLLVQFFLTHKL